MKKEKEVKLVDVDVLDNSLNFIYYLYFLEKGKVHQIILDKKYKIKLGKKSIIKKIKEINFLVSKKRKSVLVSFKQGENILKFKKNLKQYSENILTSRKNGFISQN